ncbi:hypothetical protein, partial [Streptomyces werraensis]|uniref:hypothetical protein n=1 Tax=Streptomyces werraensis TaxID=68284 RepID=UPI0036BA8578
MRLRRGVVLGLIHRYGVVLPGIGDGSALRCGSGGGVRTRLGRRDDGLGCLSGGVGRLRGLRVRMRRNGLRRRRAGPGRLETRRGGPGCGLRVRADGLEVGSGRLGRGRLRRVLVRRDRLRVRVDGLEVRPGRLGRGLLVRRYGLRRPRVRAHGLEARLGGLRSGPGGGCVRRYGLLPVGPDGLEVRSGGPGRGLLVGRYGLRVGPDRLRTGRARSSGVRPGGLLMRRYGLTRGGNHRLRSRTGSQPVRHGTRRHGRDPLCTREFLTARHLTRRHHGGLRSRRRHLRGDPLPRGPGLRRLPRLLVLVRPGRRQREHRARRGLLRRSPLVRGGQRTPAPSGRLRLLIRSRALGGHVHGDRAGRAVRLAGRGQRRRERLLLTGRAPGPASGRRGHT